MCSRKWLMPFSAVASKREPTRAQSATCTRWSCGSGATTTRSPLARQAVRCEGEADIVNLDRAGAGTGGESVFVFVLARGPRAPVDARLLHVGFVDLHLALGLFTQALDVQRQRLVALGTEQLLLERLAVLLELLARGDLVLLQPHDGEAVGSAHRVRHDVALLGREGEAGHARRALR